MYPFNYEIQRSVKSKSCLLKTFLNLTSQICAKEIPWSKSKHPLSEEIYFCTKRFSAVFNTVCSIISEH